MLDDALQRRAFEAELKVNPYDELCHRAFADWLEERGFDDEAAHHRLWTPVWQAASDRLLAYCKKVNLNHAYFLEQAKLYLADAGHEIDVTLNTSNDALDEEMPALWADAAVVLRATGPDGGGAIREGNPFTCGDFCYPRGVSWDEIYVEEWHDDDAADGP